MTLKNYNPTTPSRRALVLVDKSEVYKGKPLKNLRKAFQNLEVEITEEELQFGGEEEAIKEVTEL